MAKYIIVALLVSVFALGALLKKSYEANGEKDAQIEAKDSLLKAQASIMSRQNIRAVAYEDILLDVNKEKKEQERKAKEFQYAYQQAKENKIFRDWDDTPLPTDVFGLLNENDTNSD